MSSPIRVLTFSTLFPSSVRPGHGIFVETRLRELLSTGRVEAKVVAPVPWFPSTDARWGDYARFARTPMREDRNGIEVLHPRYLLAPKVGMSTAPFSLALGARAAVRKMLDEGFDFDLIDAHYFYPDGVAAALLARHFGKPFTITARGSDLNLISQYALPRQLIQWAGARASACIGVSGALVDVMRELGMPGEGLHMMRNGVDLQRFRPLERAQVRQELGLNGSPLLLSVGNLVELKGHAILIEALARLLPSHPDARLVLIGEGPERDRLTARSRELGLADRVTLAGALPNSELFKWYSAADVSLLASSREGWANVLLESMACGTPVVATAVGGSPEIVAGDTAGLLVRERSAEAFGAAIGRLLADPPQRSQVRAYAEGFGWQATSAAQLALFGSIADGRRKEFAHA